ncbi:hypothetical protein HAX54_013039 [Datura stramonium]|uniref:Uncharacterized protein n=1 Tax=Datura stramonium TaxID=4076 RepID=A0ABS8TKN6_DATST|nr:hypothetical protein [Datura stramonium]
MGSLLMDSLRMISDLVHGLLELEGALVGSSRTEKIAVGLIMIESDIASSAQTEESIDMMQKGSWSILDKRFLYENMNRSLKGRRKEPLTRQEIYSITWIGLLECF